MKIIIVLLMIFPCISISLESQFIHLDMKVKIDGLELFVPEAIIETGRSTRISTKNSMSEEVIMDLFWEQGPMDESVLVKMQFLKRDFRGVPTLISKAQIRTLLGESAQIEVGSHTDSSVDLSVDVKLNRKP